MSIPIVDHFLGRILVPTQRALSQVRLRGSGMCTPRSAEMLLIWRTSEKANPEERAQADFEPRLEQRTTTFDFYFNAVFLSFPFVSPQHSAQLIDLLSSPQVPGFHKDPRLYLRRSLQKEDRMVLPRSWHEPLLWARHCGVRMTSRMESGSPPEAASPPQSHGDVPPFTATLCTPCLVCIKMGFGP